MTSRGAKSKGSSSSNTRSSGGGVKFLLHAPLRNNQHTPVDNNKWCFTGGYVGLFGDLMDNYTSADDSLIPESYKQNQRDRDGNQYHMTIMLKNDFKRLAERVDEMFAETIDKIEAREKGTLPKGFQDNKGIRFLYVMSELISRDDFKDVGIGKVNQGAEEAFFRVIDWQSANQFLEKVGMPRKDFHVTLGFKTKDIHNVSKNIHTLVRPQ